MGNSALFNIGTRAMFASYAALQTTGNNISNANVKGYSRQTAELETATGQYTGAGFFGKGVTVSTVTRAHSEFLTREAATTKAAAAADDARSTQLQALEKVFPTGEDGFGYAAQQVLNAFADVASNPADSSARQVVLARASELTLRFQQAGAQLDTIQSGINGDLRSAVTNINALAKHIGDINSQIAATRGSGHTPNDLLDQRDLAINELSQYVQVSTVAADDGSMSVFIGGGQRLVLGGQASNLTTVADEYDPQVQRVAIADGATPRVLDDSVLTGGSIAGLLRFQRNDLTDARNLLGQLATAISGAVNQQQSLGLDLGTPPSAGGSVFAVGATRVLQAATNTGTANISVAVSDASAVLPNDYELTYDGANYALQRLNSPDAAVTVTPAQLAAGYQINGITVRINSGTPASGDTFLVQPLAAAARDMKRVLDDPKGLAAASPVIASTAAGNSGTMSVANVDVQSPITPPATAVQVRFNTVPGGYTYALSTDGGTTFSAAAPYTAGMPISYSPAPGVTEWQLRVNGTPADGDIVNVSPTGFTSQNNGNANAMLALRDRLVVAGTTITDSYADTLANIGVRVQGAKNAAQMSSSVAEDTESQRAGQAGVNLDEEAARLMQYQQAYQAAAKMLQVAQTVFDTLLQAGGA